MILNFNSNRDAGDNYYGVEIKNVLEPIKESKERENYLLLDLVAPKQTNNYILNSVRTIKEKNFKQDQLVSELSIFGCLLGDDQNIDYNFEAGCALRSKPSNLNETGLVLGDEVLDSVFLY